MVQIQINGMDAKLQAPPSTWRELLIDVEASCLQPNQVISSVQFDGAEVEAFRDEDILMRPLGTVGEIRIAAVDMRELSLDALRDSHKHIESLAVAIVDAAELYRNLDSAAANENLPRILEGIKLYMAILRGFELSLTTTPAITPSIVERTIEQMKPVLEALITAQQDRDWQLLADILEYELISELSAFEPVVEQFKLQLEHR